MTKDDKRLHALEVHVRSFWNGHILAPAPWDRGPILERVPHFSIYQVFPQRAGEAWVYVTLGCSLDAPNAEGIEFFVMSPAASSIHSETLAMVSHYHSFDVHQLSIGSVVDIGRPWMPNSRMDHLLVSLPYPYGPKLEWAPIDAGSARFLWLLPIHKSEAEFIQRESLEEFESMLDAQAVNVLDPNRHSVI
ncbi:suppressor of fused domain protein [Streptomyces yangpuensis]|uniref:suppressor of fused domain protein n=1 Tax=Streptomyces yangpuensis TaxID=1648182 RepID=UPI00099E92B5|nr:suppressor of fused domain protein [Streptomyces yangpuensis]